MRVDKVVQIANGFTNVTFDTIRELAGVRPPLTAEQAQRGEQAA